MKNKYLLAILIVIISFAIIYHNKILASIDFNNSKEEIVLRKIGHDLLNSVNDSTSRVLAIKKTANNEFSIYFEKSISFSPDTLVDIIRNNVKSSSFPQSYIVNTRIYNSKKNAHSFSVSIDSTKNIIPCVGRKLPKNNYIISVKFIPDNNYYLYIIILLVAILLIILLVKRNAFNLSKANTTNQDYLLIGNYLFYYKQHYLLHKEEKIKLTAKETKLLYVFALSINQVVDRNTLLKEVWENQGVITTRSLDMFISKLRKKLDKDSSLNVANIHGVGYMLEIL